MVISNSSLESALESVMGQRPSSTILRPKISLTWVLRGQQQSGTYCGNKPIPDTSQIHHNDRSSKRCVRSAKDNKGKENNNEKSGKRRIFYRNEKLEAFEKKDIERDAQIINKERVQRTMSEPSLVLKESSTIGNRDKHKHRRTRRAHHRQRKQPSAFGYEIADLDAFFSKASIESPANIPVVLSFPSVLYQTQGGTQDEVALPLGTVVNAVFKNEAWLYVQTPHGQEGYVGYTACLPLGILPQPTCGGPCWEDSTDVFPKPIGNIADSNKVHETKSECGSHVVRTRRGSSRDATVGEVSCGELGADRQYQRAATSTPGKFTGSRYTLLVIGNDYKAPQENSLSVRKGDVVALLSDNLKDWFWVRSRDGREGFIPAVIAGHGFL